MKYFFLLISISFFACTHLQKHINTEANISSFQKTVNTNDPSLNFKNGYWFYAGELFSGTITDLFNNKTIHHSTKYLNGKEEGWQIIFYEDGTVSEKRFYAKGEKDGTHTGWWQNGNMRFEYHFDNGIYEGDYKEWYQSGKPLKHIHYTKGIDDWGKGWRETGKLYMNYIMKDGRRYGIVNSNLCYTVKKGNGEYVNSVAGN